MANVATKVDTEVATDTSWLGSQWLGLAQHLTALIDNVLALEEVRGENVR